MEEELPICRLFDTPSGRVVFADGSMLDEGEEEPIVGVFAVRVDEAEAEAKGSARRASLASSRRRSSVGSAPRLSMGPPSAKGSAKGSVKGSAKGSARSSRSVGLDATPVMAPRSASSLPAARSMGAKSRCASVEADPDDLPLRSGGEPSARPPLGAAAECAGTAAARAGGGGAAAAVDAARHLHAARARRLRGGGARGGGEGADGRLHARGRGRVGRLRRPGDALVLRQAPRAVGRHRERLERPRVDRRRQRGRRAVVRRVRAVGGRALRELARPHPLARLAGRGLAAATSSAKARTSLSASKPSSAKKSSAKAKATKAADDAEAARRPSRLRSIPMPSSSRRTSNSRRFQAMLEGTPADALVQSRVDRREPKEDGDEHGSARKPMPRPTLRRRRRCPLFR